MLQELMDVFKVCGENATRNDYAKAIIEHNYLGKRTASTRKLTFQRLRELYGLDLSLPMFRMIRHYWKMDEPGRPVLALMTALARDPLLRITAEPVLRMQPGEELARQQMTDTLKRHAGDRFNDSTLDKVVRNTSSSWTQSGHLKGRGRKIRQRIQPTPFVAAFALLLGYFLGIRGSGLFHTFWARVLDVSADELTQLAIDAKRLGLLDMKRAGGIVAVSFNSILTVSERLLIHGTN